MIQPLKICQLGRMDYEQALKIQLQLLERRQQDLVDDTLLLVEHPPVLTLGVRGQANNIYLSTEQLAAEDVQVYEVNRGGDVTYHGPGQIVGYPIMKIDRTPGSLRDFVSNIELGLIKLLQDEFAIDALQRHDKYTGVWVGDRKIVAIGIAVKQYVSMHGFAFNVNTNLSHFDWINPCGLSMGVTSVADLTGRTADFELVNQMVARYLADSFGRIPVTCTLADLGVSE